MIVSRNEGGRRAPVLVCDICEQPIRDGGLAAAVFQNEQKVGVELDQILHVHKGKCMDAAEAKLGGSLVTGWRELSDHLIDLLHNCGFTMEKLAELKGLSDRNRF